MNGRRIDLIFRRSFLENEKLICYNGKKTMEFKVVALCQTSLTF